MLNNEILDKMELDFGGFSRRVRFRYKDFYIVLFPSKEMFMSYVYEYMRKRKFGLLDSIKNALTKALDILEGDKEALVKYLFTCPCKSGLEKEVIKKLMFVNIGIYGSLDNVIEIAYEYMFLRGYHTKELNEPRYDLVKETDNEYIYKNIDDSMECKYDTLDSKEMFEKLDFNNLNYLFDNDADKVALANELKAGGRLVEKPMFIKLMVMFIDEVLSLEELD